jgi:hypothetical protein
VSAESVEDAVNKFWDYQYDEFPEDVDDISFEYDDVIEQRSDAVVENRYDLMTLEELHQQSKVYHRGFYIATKKGHEGMVHNIDTKIQAVDAELTRRAKDMDEAEIWEKAVRKRIKLANIN